ncbi:MAG: hypothetical protein CMN34_01465, partial [Saprospirales bacterium]|nr:hypothetical protein [Saprospirales bacterium]
MNRLSLFLKITAVIFLTFFLGNSNIIAQATVCPTTSSYTYGTNEDASDAIDFVVANPTDLISMDFTSGSTESCCDQWFITDGAGGTGNEIASGYGAISTTTTYTSTTGTISFYVESDYSVNGTTFNFSVSCSSPAACATPTTPIISGITGSTVDYTFTDNASATQWQIAWGTTGFDPTTATLDATNSSIETSTTTGISGLVSGTDYEVYVRAICGAGDTSNWSAVTLFRTVAGCGYSGTYTYGNSYGPSDAIDFVADNAGDWISLD